MNLAAARLPPRPQLVRWGRKMGEFFLGQGAIQLLSLVTGFLIIRWLSVESYAQYSVAFGFQSSVGMLVDLGFSGAIVALVGPRISDPAVTGRYIRSVLHFRTLLFVIAAPIAAIAFIWMTGRQGWSTPARAALFSSVLFSLFFQGWTSCYSAPLAMHQRYGPMYRAQISSGIWRLAGFGLLHALTSLSAAAAAWVNSAGLALLGWLYRRESRPLIEEPVHADPVANTELRRYVAPLVPSTVFNALESQITIFLITWFGKSTNIAEVAALGRLNQALVILLAFNGVVISPYVARLARSRLAGRYWLILAGGLGVGGALWTFSLLFPGVLLWIVGAKYAHLQSAVSWSIAAWAVYYLSMLMLTMHGARKWVYWWHSALHCTSLIVAQIVGVLVFDLSKTVGVLKFSLLAACTNLVVQSAAGVYGFLTDRENVPAEVPPSPAADPETAAAWGEPEAVGALPAGGGGLVEPEEAKPAA